MCKDIESFYKFFAGLLLQKVLGIGLSIYTGLQHKQTKLANKVYIFYCLSQTEYGFSF